MPRPPRFSLALEDHDDPRPLCLFPQGREGLPKGSVCVQPLFGPYQRLNSAGFETTTFDTLPISDTAIVFATRARGQTLGAVSTGLKALAPGGRLVLDGAKTDGMDGLVKTLKTAFTLDGTASRDHGKVVWLTRPEALPAAVDEWARAAAPHQGSDGLWRQAGVFSADGLDPGTALLSAHLPPVAPKRMADFGAGWGALSLGLAATYPDVHLDVIEADALALNLARKNLAGAAKAHFHWADVTQLPAGLDGYDLIVSNPPFHASRKAEPALGARFIEAAQRALSPKGTFVMVANRQLAYEATLDRCFGQWETVIQTPVYKVIRATRPAR